MLGLSDRLPMWLRWDRIRPPSKFTREVLWGLVLGVTFSLSSTSLAILFQGWRRRRAVSHIPPRPIELRSDEIVDGVIGLIGAPKRSVTSPLTRQATPHWSGSTR